MSTKKTRVLVISHTYISSINRSKWKTIAACYPDVIISVIFPDNWPTCLFNHEIKDETIQQYSNCSFTALKIFKAGNELLYNYKFNELYKIIKTFKPDIIHVEQGDGALSYFQANICLKLLKSKAKSIFFTWVNWQPQQSIKHKLFLRPLEKINLRCADGAIAGNQDAHDILRKKDFKKPILILPQIGFDEEIFKPIGTSVTRAKNYIGYIGRLTEEKGIFLLCEVFIKLSHSSPSWNLLFIGRGNATNKLRSFVASKQMHERIFFQDSLPPETIAKILPNLDILVLPSYDTPTWREQFGHILIEAMACKVPIIGSNAGEIPNVITDTGLIFEQKNQESLLAQLKTLMQDEDLRQTLATQGYQRAHQEYSHTAIAHKTYHFWQQILAT